MKTYTLPKKTLTLWRIRISALALALLLVCFYLPLPFNWELILSGVILLFFCAAFFWYLPGFVRSCNLTVTNNSVIIKRGIIVENTHILPFTRLIHTQLIQTPLSKLFMLTMITLKSARFNIIVFELPESDAKSLISEITAEGGYE